VIVVIIAVAVGVSAGGSGKNSDTVAPCYPQCGHKATPAAAPSPTMDSQDQQFVSDMQSAFNFDSSVADSDLSTFGESICTDLGNGGSLKSEVSFAQTSWTHMTRGEGLAQVRLAETDICPQYLKAETVTYKVTGYAPAGYIGATITYGPDGSTFNGRVPMRVTHRLPANPADYYSIDAQLSDAGGHVTCEILVDGLVISRSSARGAANIASCQAGFDSMSGEWSNENGG